MDEVKTNERLAIEYFLNGKLMTIEYLPYVPPKLTWQERADAVRRRRKASGREVWVVMKPSSGFSSPRQRKDDLSSNDDDYWPPDWPPTSPADEPSDYDPEMPLRLKVPPPGVRWYCIRGSRLYGLDAQGHDILYDSGAGKIRWIYSLRQKADAVILADELGVATAAKQLDIPRLTLKNWMRSERADLRPWASSLYRDRPTPLDLEEHHGASPYIGIVRRHWILKSITAPRLI